MPTSLAVALVRQSTPTARRTEVMDLEVTDMAATVVMEGTAAAATVVVATVAEATAVAAVAVAIDLADRMPHLRSSAGCRAPLALKRASLLVYSIGNSDPFGIPSSSRWTGAAIVEQSARTKTCVGNTDISSRFNETSGLPVTRA
jgi:hypothetical protein